MTSRRVRQDRKLYVLLLLPVAFMVGGLALLSFVVSSHTALAASAGPASPTAPKVDLMTLNSEINSASLHYLTNAINTAESDGSQALVIELNTPGGAIDSMVSMITAEMNSKVPIISYTAPSGAFAASAGAFVELAAHVAAMAPSTTIGASSPVDSTGGDLSSTEKAKVESVLESDMTNIQTRYGRKVDPAVLMVKNAASYTDQQAKALGIIDIDSSSLTDLLNQVDGRSVTLSSGQAVTLHTAGVTVQNIDPGTFDTLYALLLDPNVLFMLFIVAVIGIFIEISHPGAILPGVAGGIALVLFLLGSGSLAPNWAGLALMMLALVLLIVDVRVPTHGVLTVGAVISLIFGTLLFFNSGGPYQGAQVNPAIVYIMSGLVGCLGFYVVTMIVRTRRRRVTTGPEGMIGAKVVALTALLPEGRVSYGGEDWAAVIDPPTVAADPGSELRIVSLEGLLLHVQPVVHTLSSSTPKDIPGA